MTKNILITGGDGFIAKSLNEYFADDYNVYLCGREKLDLLNANGVFEYIKDNNFDVIIHSANYDAVPTFSTKDPNKVLQSNLAMFYNIVRCKKRKDTIYNK